MHCFPDVMLFCWEALSFSKRVLYPFWPLFWKESLSLFLVLIASTSGWLTNQRMSQLIAMFVTFFLFSLPAGYFPIHSYLDDLCQRYLRFYCWLFWIAASSLLWTLMEYSPDSQWLAQADSYRSQSLNCIPWQVRSISQAVWFVLWASAALILPGMHLVRPH